MRRIRYRRSAQRDLDMIWTYIAERDTGAADRLIANFLHAVLRLIEHPRSAPAHPELGRDFRAISVRGHQIIYRIDDDVIDIVRVIDARRDVIAAFKLRSS